MKLLFTGRPNKGSWQIRGVQMAQGLGTCIPFATTEQCKQFDFIVVVKNALPAVVQAVRASGKPWAYDFVDAYPQPTCSAWSKDQAIAWVRRKVMELHPNVVVWANDRMRSDMAMGGEVILHHSRPGLQCNPIRRALRKVGYEGSPNYLGAWRKHLHHAVAKIGAEFVENPGNLADLDVVVAFRQGPADCYATRHWKSNVKLANAHGSGTPFMGQPDDGYLETKTGNEQWVTDFHELEPALVELMPQERRSEIAISFLQSKITLEQCQQQWLEIARRYS